MGMIALKEPVIRNWLASKIAPPCTIEELAEKMGVAPSLLYMIFSHKRQVTTHVLRQLCKVTGYDVADVCYYDKDKEPQH